MSIEEVAKRVKELAEGGGLLGVDRRTGEEYDLRDLAPQLAEWVEKALPVIESARAVELSDSLSSVRPAIACWDAQIGELRRALRALDPPSSLAAEGTTEGASPPP